MSAGLNPAQNEAVRYLDGPCLVLAGAGSGKTRVITQKIAHLIEAKGFEPRHIAAVTFTNKAAAEMRERVGKLLEGKTLTTPGKEGRKVPVNQLTVCTFHSLGVQILRQEAEHVGLKPQFSIMDSDDCFGMIQEQVGSTDKGFIRKIQSIISLWKNGLIMPEEAIAIAANEDEHQAAIVYRNYVATLHAYQAVDFDDLIRLPAELFAKNEQVRERWQNKLRYLLIDEYQDTNACQYELVKLLAGKRAAFTAVGDDDQAIYGWRGATLENLGQLSKDFPKLHLIKLEQNYRSTVRILTAANNVIANNPKLFEKKLWSEHGMGDTITVTPLQRRRARGRVGGVPPVRAQVRAAREFPRLRDPVSRQLPGAHLRTGAAARADSVRAVRRPVVLRQSRDQGHLRVSASDRQCERRPRVHPRDHHAAPRRRQYDARSARLVRGPGEGVAVRGGVHGRHRGAPVAASDRTDARVLRLHAAPHRSRGEGRGRHAARRTDGRDPLRSVSVRRIRRTSGAGQVAERAGVHGMAQAQGHQGRARGRRRTAKQPATTPPTVSATPARICSA